MYKVYLHNYIMSILTKPITIIIHFLLEPALPGELVPPRPHSTNDPGRVRLLLGGGDRVNKERDRERWERRGEERERKRER